MAPISPSDSLRACLDELRSLDHDRFLTTLFAPAGKRARLVALYAFNVEIARVRETVSEPMLGRIRLQWWREAIEGIERGEVRGHEAAVALAEMRGERPFPARELIALIDARERDLDDEPFADMAALEAYAEATSTAVMRLATAALGATVPEGAVRNAGIAYALTGLLRALPLHASQGRLFMPADLLRLHDVDPHTILTGRMTEGLRGIMHDVADRARALLVGARREPVPRAALPALLPASLCDRYLSIVSAPGFDIFHQSTEVPAFIRQSRLAAKKLMGQF